MAWYNMLYIIVIYILQELLGIKMLSSQKWLKQHSNTGPLILHQIASDNSIYLYIGACTYMWKCTYTRV